eukprot:GEMP01135202.1.p1 GENE.GEMP01135202.1~~GEMP01135202.1.p1  ORF type:complete len:124 (+),score=12.75 GEMP01135202.1:89-460(+)
MVVPNFRSIQTKTENMETRFVCGDALCYFGDELVLCEILQVGAREDDPPHEANTKDRAMLLPSGMHTVSHSVLLPLEIFHLRQRLIFGVSAFLSPLSFSDGAFARFSSVGPFLGGNIKKARRF